MRDIPFFTIAAGVASLTLSDIPYTKKAYIRIQHANDPRVLLQESVQFCRLAGAEKVFCTGHCVCEQYPFHTSIVEMQADIDMLGQTDVSLFPVTEGTLEEWIRIYNRKIADVPNGAWMSRERGKSHLSDGYFVHENGRLLGIGIASGDQIDWVASVVPGAGEEVVKALCHALSSDIVKLQVASSNRKAMELYIRMGFVQVKELSCWYFVNEL